MTDFKKIVLDARDLEHPKPLELAIKALREVDDETYFYMIHRKNPIPLLALASEQGFYIFNQEDIDGNWHVLICKNSSIDLSELVVTAPAE